MRAFRLVEWQTPRLIDVPRPEPGPGDVLVRVGGVGLCGTDLKLMAATSGIRPPYTLGHEIAGWIEATGSDVNGLRAGTAVALTASNHCGACYRCQRGATNYCPRTMTGRGFGLDGGLADFVVAPAHHVLPLGGIEPCDAAPLTDAAVTAYHAVSHVARKLTAGSTAVVIGTGGLGGFAVQHLRLLTEASVIAIDVSPQRLEFATDVGAHVALPAADDNHRVIRELTNGDGATAVLDFVGVESAVQTAMAAVAPLGSVLLVGGGGGSVPFGHTTLPRGVDILSPTGSTVDDLRGVLALAQSGSLRIESELFPLDGVRDAYDALRDGALRSRAVVVP